MAAKQPKQKEQTKEEKEKEIEEMIDRIHYSDRYDDEQYIYRHVILPKPLLKFIPDELYDKKQPGVLRILSEDEWRAIGITQSMGWEHYEVHAPEPHVLLFRRDKSLDYPTAVPDTAPVPHAKHPRRQ